MRPVNGESSGRAPPERPSRPLFPVGSLPLLEMSLLQSLGPVQTWLGQELEKCGIDAMIYTRYVLSLLLHDSYDYDLQDQENDIFLGWEKGTGKRWKSRRKGGGDLSLEEMKKHAAVQCLRSASDENSEIESLVEELCSKLKDIQNKQKEKEKQPSKKSDESRSPELTESPSSKDQVEMYYEAFPPLSEKPVCLQEIMTVWNKAKACTYSSSSSSAAPQTSTDTSSPKDCTSEGEGFKDKGPDALSTTMTNEKIQQRRSKKEKENRYHGGATGVSSDQAASQNKRQNRNRSDLGHRPRSWSSGSSEGGSSSSGHHGDTKTSGSKGVRFRQKSREVSSRNKKGRSCGQVKLALKCIDKEECRNPGSVSGMFSEDPSKPQHYRKKGKRSLREMRKDPSCVEPKEAGGEAGTNKEYMEEPLWYTEPISEYFVPFSRSKLETKYRSKHDPPSDPSISVGVGCLTERMHGICMANPSFERAYLAAGTFVDGHFVEVSGEGDEEEAAELNGISSCLPPEDAQDLDDEHLCEFAHFYEVDIYHSILDPSASDAVHESRILNMIRQKSNEPRDVEAGCHIFLDGLELQAQSAIKGEPLGNWEADVSLMQDLESIAHVWECCSSSSSEDLEAESCAGNSPARLSPVLGSVPFGMRQLPGSLGDLHPMEGCGSTSALSSCFSLFELQCERSAFPFPCDSLTQNRDNMDSNSCLDPLVNKQSRLLIWTKNSAFDETEHCSNLSTRTCSPWSHSEETRSDCEQIGAPMDESTQFGSEEVGSVIPPIPVAFMDEELLDFLQENPGHQQDETGVGTVSNQTFNKVSKLESVCGIALEQDECKQYNTVLFSDDTNQQSDDYSSGIIKDIWMAIGDKDCVLALGMEKAGENLFSEETPRYQCCCCLDVEGKDEPFQKKAVQRSEYHLWEGQKEDQGLAKSKASKMDGGDYTTPARPWDAHSEKSGTSFILGGVYGELKTIGSDKEWTLVPPGDTCGNLLQCATAASDVVTIAGADVFMNAGSCFAPGQRPLWRPLVSLGQNDQANKGAGDGLNKGFSVIFHEDLLGTCSGYCGEEQGLECPFSSLDLNNPFSQVLHVECSFEPEDMASFSPGFKPKSILCSDSDSEPFCSRLYNMNRTQYRAIRISPRTHFRPISASELSPGWCSVSDAESDKEERSLPISGQTDLFDDPQADLKPLEEDAECEAPYYGMSELESGKFLPRLKKSGMEKSAQTSLDSQEGGAVSLPSAEREVCLDCNTAGASAAETTASPRSEGPEDTPHTEEDTPHTEEDTPHSEESCTDPEACRCGRTSDVLEIGKPYDVVPDLHKFPLLGFGEQGVTAVQQSDCWWQNTLCSSLVSGSQCTGSSNM